MGTFVNGIYLPTAGEQDWDNEVNDNFRRVSELAVNVKAKGAVGNGSASDATAIQAAQVEVTAAGGGVVYFPPGTYKYDSNTAINPSIRTHWVGAGSDISQVAFTGTNAIKFPGASTMQAFRDLTLSTTNADLMVWPDSNYASNISIERCHLLSLSTTKRLIYSGAGGWSNFGRILGCTLEASGGATVSPIEVESSSNWNANLVQGCVFQCNSGLTVPFVKMTNTNDAGYMYQNNFKDIWVENGIGGAIHMYSAWGCAIEDVYSYDNTAPATDDFIKINKDTGGQDSRYITIARPGFNGTFAAGKYLVNVQFSYGTLIEPDNQPLNIGGVWNLYGGRPTQVTGTPTFAAYEIYHTRMSAGTQIFTKAGAIVDGDFASPQNGMIAIDTTNSRIYVRIGGTWKSVVVA